MTRKGIIINWWGGVEIIEGDFDDPESLKSISHSREWWNDEDYEARYNLDSNIRKARDGSYVLTLEYHPEKNEEIPFDKVCWGISKIRFRPGDMAGKAEWKDFYDEENNDEVDWERLEQPLTGEKRRISTTKIQRAQAWFRERLLQVDGKCVITGEMTSESLDAAHIIPVKDGGMEVWGNGIILRTDIHRLYDAGYFEIKENGRLTILEEGLSESYVKILEKSEVHERIMDRIRPALQEKSKLKVEPIH